VPDGTDVAPVPKLDLSELETIPDVSCDKMLLSAGADGAEVVAPARAGVVCELDVPIVAPASIEDIADDTLGFMP